MLEGPPGTGKTFVVAEGSARLLSETRGIRDTVPVHTSYAYEDFMQGIRPEVVGGQLLFKLVPGRFLEFCRRASAMPFQDLACVFVLDRRVEPRDCSRVFGELMYIP